MDLLKLYEMQKVLDEKIEKEHPRTKGENRLNKKIIAFIVELSEMLNEKRSIFKFWSNKKDDNKKALEEYVDGLHFLLSIGLETGHIIKTIEGNVLDYNDIQVQVLETIHSISGMCEWDYPRYERAFELYIGLADLLGFTWDEIEQAYMKKNAVNHERQNKGY